MAQYCLCSNPLNPHGHDWERCFERAPPASLFLRPPALSVSWRPARPDMRHTPVRNHGQYRRIDSGPPPCTSVTLCNVKRYGYRCPVQLIVNRKTLGDVSRQIINPGDKSNSLLTHVQFLMIKACSHVQRCGDHGQDQARTRLGLRL